jgi:hypothetical protein
MLENAPDVSCHFKGQTSCYGSGESLHAEEKGLDELSNEEDAKQGQVDTVAWDGGLVMDVSILYGTGIESTKSRIHDEGDCLMSFCHCLRLIPKQ